MARESHLGNHEVSFTSRCSDTHIQLVFNAKHYKKDSRSLQFVWDMYIFDKQIDRQAAIATISQRCCTFSSSRDVWSPPFPNRTLSLPVIFVKRTTSHVLTVVCHPSVIVRRPSARHVKKGSLLLLVCQW